MNFKYVSLFSGLGGFDTALNRLGGECVMASETDKFAVKAYEAIYGIKPKGDVTKIPADDVPDHDILTAGFPCQSFSIAGKRKGFDDTRGTLFFEVARIAKVKKPKVVLLENVKGLVNHDKGNTLKVILETMEELGYTVQYRILNSKHYGVPQNRERIFIVCIRDQQEEFNFPDSDEVTTRLLDVLEDNPDEKYYLSEEKTKHLLSTLKENWNPEEETDKPQAMSEGNGVSLCLDANYHKGVYSFKQCIRTHIGIRMDGRIDLNGPDTCKRVYDPAGISPTSATMTGGHRQPKIVVQLTERRTEEAKRIRREYKKKYGKDYCPRRAKELVPRKDGISNCITATQSREHMLLEVPLYRIRKLTPLECLRLQGFPDDYHDKLREVKISDTQIYKMAGNAVTVNVVEEIGKELIKHLEGDVE